MKIGEVAALVGVSSRTVRHYHHLGLLPEPARLANGYRDYRVRDAVLLARARRLVELGLSLDEVRDVLNDDRGRELREVLGELDADLARRQEALAVQRARLAGLLAETDLGPDSAVSPEMADVLRELPRGAGFAEVDRGLLALVDTAAGPEERGRFAEMLRPFTEPETAARVREVYARLDGLAGAGPDDPRVGDTAEAIAALIPDELATLVADRGEDVRWIDDMTPAQGAVFSRVVELLRERVC
ncbi:MerR family transcriptional regulator [Actinomadura graeca]|uniref:MerR family transcriptional regulator n=1 Tax=Actinomadura graeca TaxID=2750812 RepID=A0ABX8QXR4_9ACTN|nr:MerR family transcriptional regulator [Actinomadura graeca]QXJ23635.1 MerR family transcriptional regulator [Actinomadura graeca]